MKVSGLSQEHLELIVNLEEMEKFFLDKDSIRPPEVTAKGLTCLAHDWIKMGLEEKGHELLIKADNACPGYHKNKMKEDMDEDPEFASLVYSLSKELILVALSTVRDN